MNLRRLRHVHLQKNEEAMMHKMPAPGSGRGKAGWLCSFVPEELLMAAGFDPCRVDGRVETIERADAYTFSNLCPYVKNVLDAGLRGRLADLSMVVLAHACDGVRRLHDLWGHAVVQPPAFFLDVPKNTDETAVTFYAARLADLKGKLEETFSVAITDERLAEAIAFMNGRRRRAAPLFALQKQHPPSIAATALHELLHAEQTRPKGETEALLDAAAAGQAGAAGTGNGGPRLVVAGGRLDRPELFSYIEAAGGTVVLCDTCQGLRHYEAFVEENVPPLTALARRYLTKTGCPRMPGAEERLKRLAALAEEYDARGIVYAPLRFCDYGLFEAPVLEAFFRLRGLPVLVLENNYVWTEGERLRTRVEAFVEMVASGG
ncbi:MAG TPA: 2-hydroxyacyl-CoA dehydratase family protein [Spirochaetota bacterium]|nr:2-hydroxyacyl-CoA dehydratase family protein [Spirochaetota bacterium]